MCEYIVVYVLIIHVVIILNGSHNLYYNEFISGEIKYRVNILYRLRTTRE